MARISPWYSTNQPVYHNNTKCTEGDNMEPQFRRGGTGGKPLCGHCKKINEKDRVTREHNYGTGLPLAI